ncbi:MAG: flagellar biosynthesis protein FlgJ [Sphingomonas sp. SCN 67-18]|uniref:lytic transglycosylase domain-containing protein n=1 Tax=uncultured Sphingomonas sp. TaxID=158754 RepID=UPI00086AD2D5|nr:lytic transglycosylase domain-containing protein [Sphingomonas sp. SCN 67-18]ODU21587.1 MAG: flagellar biosynthesis protein FlgJ [Sphingomonas sp. SCN 67-18]
MAITGLTAAVAPGGVQSAIARASAKTGVDFNYLLGQAQVESSLRADARAATSSATGLYQFVDQSWLAVMKRHGDEHGLGWAADAISQGANGRYHVADGETRRAILNLRTNSEVASLMAAEHAADNKEALEGALGRNVGGTDLYMAHFLGLGGARKFLATLASDPDRSGAAMFPAAARANRSIFYAPDGQARSLDEIYDRFANRIERGAQLAGGGKVLPAIAGGKAATAPMSLAQLTAMGGEVIQGTGSDANESSTLDRLLAGGGGEARSLLRPTPESAKLAYLMLATLGG